MDTILKKMITLQKFIALSNNIDIIYCPIYYINQEKFPALKPEFTPPNHPYKLITHGGDATITEDCLPILNSENLIAWYSINVGISHPKLHHIPIGVNFLGESTEQDFLDIINLNIEKTNTLYTNFSLYVWDKERKRCNDALKKIGYTNLSENNSLSLNPTIPYKKYLADLASHKFCVTPIGNGFDTFRLWECLYLKVVPIMVNKISGDKYYGHYKKMLEDFPILWIDSWDDLKADDLNKSRYVDIIETKKFGLEKLNFDYWKNLIIR